MRLMLHTFEKDARRLWPAATVTWIMLAVLAYTDRWRADWIASPMEGWLNLLLPLAWACLAALALLEEPLIGDRSFWMTRPHRWPELLGAKLLFAIAAIHIPVLIADSYILAARGFSPAGYAPVLLWKQALLFGAITLPSIAIASVLRNFTQFVVAVLLVAAALAILNGGFDDLPAWTRQSAALRHAMVRVLLAAGAAAVIWTQYARRRALPARVVAAGAAIGAICVSTWLPVRAEYALPGRGLRQPPQISLRTRLINALPLHPFNSNTVIVQVPIEISGAPGSYYVPMVEADVVTPDGTTIRAITPPRAPQSEIDLAISLVPWPIFATVRGTTFGPPGILSLRFSGRAWERVRNVPVRLRGSMAFQFHEPGPAAQIPTIGAGFVPGVGRCTAGIVHGLMQDDMLKVLCESPNPIPETKVTLRHEASERVWQERLNSAYTFSRGPHQTWLSPLYRGECYFHLDTRGEGSNWVVPASHLENARIQVAPEVTTGHAVARFDFTDVRLAQ